MAFTVQASHEIGSNPAVAWVVVSVLVSDSEFVFVSYSAIVESCLSMAAIPTLVIG